MGICRLRLCTFNVNGKIPTQDLSSWVQGNINGGVPDKENTESITGANEKPSPTFPPLQRISPFSVPEFTFDWRMTFTLYYQLNPTLNFISANWRRQQSTEAEASQTDSVSKEFPIRVDLVDPDEPDVYVFAFQELDLSAEALLYSTSTAREDLWYQAIISALGEKGVKYEKVVFQISNIHSSTEIIAISLLQNNWLACFYW